MPTRILLAIVMPFCEGSVNFHAKSDFRSNML